MTRSDSYPLMRHDSAVARAPSNSWITPHVEFLQSAHTFLLTLILLKMGKVACWFKTMQMLGFKLYLSYELVRKGAGTSLPQPDWLPKNSILKPTLLQLGNSLLILQ